MILKKFFTKPYGLILLITWLCCQPVSAQQDQAQRSVFDILKQKDSLLFNVGFNQCIMKPFEDLVSDSFEFYHDEAGITSSKAKFIDGIRNGLCKLSYKPRRELDPGTLQVFLLKKGGVVYGAIQTGEHTFYALKKNKPEYVTSTAKFTHLWLLEQGTWKLSKSYSYDHKSLSKPFVLGQVRQLHSSILSEDRIVNIYLPEGYDADDTTRYPVVYLLDGSADEDFIHIAGLYQFNNFPWINRTPKSIIVGIANIDRRRDFTFPTSVARDQQLYPTTGGSAKFTGFIEKELMPFIESNFRTGKTRTIIGQSLGGLLAAEILLKRPVLFDKYIIVSPSLWWDNGSLLHFTPAAFNGVLHAKADVYIGVGKEGAVPGDSTHTMEGDARVLADKLKYIGNKSLNVYFDYLPDEDHASIMHQAVYNALRMLYATRD